MTKPAILIVSVLTSLFLYGCDQSSEEAPSQAGESVEAAPGLAVSPVAAKNPLMDYLPYSPAAGDLVISREEYFNKLQGFWLGQCIANWTGLVTEMDKIGGEGPHGEFYTRDSWGQPDQPSIWAEGKPSDLSATIDWVLEEKGGLWGADDDTDIEYMYQHLLLTNGTSMLSGEQIRDGWLKHIYSDDNTPFVGSKGEKENFLWVSNQRAHDLMRVDGLVPPATSDPLNNVEYEMIDAQLTTEIFGLFAPTRPDVALKMAYLPIRTTARENAAWVSEFYVVMHSLASVVDPELPVGKQVLWMADQARQHLPDDSYSAKMFDYVKSRYQAGVPWEQARDDVYQRYQVEQRDGYNITSRNLYCNGCFASGINFAASLVSLFYGQGDFQETVKIAVLAGWDSDNPAATWGGLLGFMHGKDGIEKAFGRKFADRFNIHRTRGNFPNDGIDTFQAMAEKGLFVVDRVVQEEMSGGIDLVNNRWLIPGSVANTSKLPAECSDGSDCTSNGSSPNMLGRFDKSKDLFLPQFDSKTDVDDIHSIAAVGTMLADPRFEAVNYHAVAGAYGYQEGEYVPANDLFKLAFGDHWSDAHNDYDKALAEVSELVISTLENDGNIWIAEAGQSDFSADMVRQVQLKLPDIRTTERIIIVQHSEWNQDSTTPAELAYVKENTRYHKIEDGNATGNGTPGFKTDSGAEWARATTDARAADYWKKARKIADKYNGEEGRYLNEDIKAGGLDFSDTAETCWIFGFSDLFDTSQFFDEFGSADSN